MGWVVDIQLKTVFIYRVKVEMVYITGVVFLLKSMP